MKTTIEGYSLIGASRGGSGGETFHGENPANGEKLEPAFHAAGEKEVERTVQLAKEAYVTFGETSGKERATFLCAIAAQIEGVAAEIKERAVAETGLPAGRIEGETGRTTGQLRLFANLIEEGSWVDARIDKSIADRKPAPKPDIRYMLKPMGPVVVFCASNFPLAFSAAGGDVASALAGGNTVIVKAHHAHPGTAEIVGHAVLRAVAECGLPEGTYSLLYGSGRVVGHALVKHPDVKAVGFTGSREGGRALFDLASARPEPIPVYAEMSSINPVFLLPSAVAAGRREEVATGLQGSLTMGVGQFCVNPGLVMIAEGADASAFEESFAKKVSVTPPGVMLHQGIRKSYGEGVARKNKAPGVKPLAVVPEAKGACLATPAVFTTDAATFLKNPALSEEVFGPSTLVVKAGSPKELLRIAENFEGQLTATIFGTEEELLQHAELVRVLRGKCGRLLFNQFPTGVEVCHSMVHGGPYPATTDGRSTSVGTAAIYRFVRPVCYQNFPQAALPDELKDANPLGIQRKVIGG